MKTKNLKKVYSTNLYWTVNKQLNEKLANRGFRKFKVVMRKGFCYIKFYSTEEAVFYNLTRNF